LDKSPSSLLEEDSLSNSIEYKGALEFVNEVIRTCESSIWRGFLETLRQYQEGGLELGEVARKVTELFQDHSILLHKFSEYVPKARSQ
jgi:histone deacetylase complex regulatory component SIN3